MPDYMVFTRNGNTYIFAGVDIVVQGSAAVGAWFGMRKSRRLGGRLHEPIITPGNLKELYRRVDPEREVAKPNA